MSESPFKFKIDLNVLNHLGLNLYSNIPAVLSEVIANAWDADASEVQIQIDKSTKKIVIKDNGCGMDENDINEKYLNVGYCRRAKPEEDKTPEFNRKIMGRKGIGKLSLFSIADQITIFTKKKGDETLGFKISVPKIRDHIENKKTSPYRPEIAPHEEHPEASELDKGTVIILEDIKKRVASSLDDQLKKRVARRFDVWDENFEVIINAEKVCVDDRDYFNKVEYIAIYGDYSTARFSDVKIREARPSPDDINVRGWIGLAKNAKLLKEGKESLNKISLFVRNKVAKEDIAEYSQDTGIYTKYLIGEIHADFLDDTSKDDIATSNRQGFLEDDERFKNLVGFITKELTHIRDEREKYKEEEGAKKAQDIPALKEWYESLQGDAKDMAKKVLGKINSIDVDDNKKKADLYKYAILAFERLNQKSQLSKLEQISVDELNNIIGLFSSIDDIEATLYHQITEGRIEVIKKLNESVKKDVLEKTLQNVIYGHLWLLDPSWDRATESPEMEKQVKGKIGDDEQAGRIDIQYKKISGKHVIIELKRPSVSLTIGKLIDQVKKYVTLTQGEMRLRNESGSVECICILGSLPTEWKSLEERHKDEETLSKQNIRVFTYQGLIKDALNSYQDYLDKHQAVGKISELLDDIDTYFSGQKKA